MVIDSDADIAFSLQCASNENLCLWNTGSGCPLELVADVLNVDVADGTLLITASGLQVDNLTPSNLPVVAGSGLNSADYV